MRKYYMRVIYKLRSIISKIFFEKSRYKKMQQQLKNNNFTLIASNCVGGMVYHDLNHPFLTPTINLYLDAEDFLKFSKNLKYYLSLPLTEIESNQPYPMAKIEDINLHMVHYDNFEEANAKWEERKKRVNFENLFLIFNDRDGFHDGMLEEFDKIPFEKVFFSHKKIDRFNWVCYLPEAKNMPFVPELTLYASIFGDKYYDKHFDFVKWLNGENVQDCIK